MTGLPKFFSNDHILRVWKDSRDSKSGYGAPGIDGMAAPTFKRQVDFQILKIIRDLREDDYKFSALSPCFVVKPNGKERLICIPTVRDRLTQRTILRQLENDPRFYKGSPISYGFTKGRSLQDGIKQALKYRSGGREFVLKVDIEQFFDKIPRDQVIAATQSIRSHRIRALIEDAVRTEVRTTNSGVKSRVLATGVRDGVGLRQGMPVSPMLSNLLLKPFDKALDQKRYQAVRYADDIALFGKTKSECEDAYYLMSNELSKLGLKLPSLNTDKCLIADRRQPIEFLGLDIKFKDGQYILNCPNKKVQKLSERFAELASIENCKKRKWNIGDLVRSLNSTEAGFSAALNLAANRSDFEKRILVAKHKALASFMSELIGPKAFAKLKDYERKILGLEVY